MRHSSYVAYDKLIDFKIKVFFVFFLIQKKDSCTNPSQLISQKFATLTHLYMKKSKGQTVTHNNS